MLLKRCRTLFTIRLGLTPGDAEMHGRTAGMLVTAGLLVLVAIASIASGPPSPSERRSTNLHWGVYQILWSRQYGAHLDAELAPFSSKPQYVMFYRDLGRPFPGSAVNAIAKRGATTIVSLELWEWHGKRKGSYLSAIVDGTYDDWLREWARAAKADGRRVLLRFGFEFNGNWFTWSGDPKAYVAAWRHAHALFDAVGADNVEWVWAPNVVSCPPTQENDMHRYYPGDAYVDWVGVDGYNFGDHHDKWHKWTSFADVFSDILTDFGKRYADKPVMITEFGCAPGKPRQRAQWIRAAHAELQRWPQVKAAVWFNYDKRREGEPNWRVDVTPESLRAFNETFAKPRGGPAQSP